MTLLCVQVVGSSETMNNLHLHLPLLFVVIVIPIQSPKFGDFESRGGCSIASYTGIRLDYIHEDCKRKTVRVDRTLVARGKGSLNFLFLFLFLAILNTSSILTFGAYTKLGRVR